MVHAGVEGEKQLGVLRRAVHLQRRRAEQVELLGVGVELDPAQAQIGNAPHLVAPVGAAEVDGAEAVQARLAFQLFREPGDGVDAGAFELVGEGGEADGAVDAAGVEQPQQPVDRAVGVDRGREHVGVVRQDVGRAARAHERAALGRRVARRARFYRVAPPPPANCQLWCKLV